MSKRGFCVLCGRATTSQSFTRVVYNPHAPRPDYCEGEGDCCKYIVEGSRPLPIHLHGCLFWLCDERDPIPLEIKLPRRDSKLGSNLCYECARANRNVHANLKERHDAERQQLQAAPLQQQGSTVSMTADSSAPHPPLSRQDDRQGMGPGGRNTDTHVRSGGDTGVEPAAARVQPAAAELLSNAVLPLGRPMRHAGVPKRFRQDVGGDAGGSSKRRKAKASK